MNAYIKLGLVALLPVVFSFLLYYLKKTTRFRDLNYMAKQIIIGIVFGLLAVLGTEYGIPINGAQVNCRDAAVLSAGLFFGSPAGIIAGIIGGVERWVAVAWGVGTYTRVACSVSTILAGVYAAGLRKYMFEEKRPNAIVAFGVGFVMEVLHLTMVFVTNMNDSEKALSVVKACFTPMVLANALSVALGAFVISLFALRALKKEQKKKKLATVIQKNLIIVIAIIFAITIAFVFDFQTKVSMNQSRHYMQTAIDDVSSDITTIRDASSDYNTIKFELEKSVVYRHVGNTGFVIVTNKLYDVISAPKSYTETSTKDIAEAALSLNGNLEPSTVFEAKINDVDYYCMYGECAEYYVLATITKAETLATRDLAVYVSTFMEVIVMAVMFAVIFLLLQKLIIKNIYVFNKSLRRISNGDLQEVVHVDDSMEFSNLSKDLNTTVATLKRHIDEANERIDADLAMAKNIQMSALCSVFPAFPQRRDFDIYACTHPAKEVGGDFYDLYLTHSRYLNILIADVSGKGIPAAMFMMKAKTLLQSLTKTDLITEEVFTEGNNGLCEGNEAGMFVTAWQGGVDLRDGTVEYANAGHNPPLVKHADGSFEYLQSKVNLVLAGMPGVKYKRQVLNLVPGDIIFLYTDGITEATNGCNELYGEERLLNLVNSRDFVDMQDLCVTVKEDVDAFVGDAPQFDDITMLAFKYYGSNAPRWFALDAKTSEIPSFTAFVDKWLEKMECPMKPQVQIDVAIDEIMNNIASYAYGEKCGRMGVVLQEINEPQHGVTLSFVDAGYAYNPLEHEDPDTTLSADEREIGGLGLLMVKKTMDLVEYEGANGLNVLTLTKYF